MPKVEEEQPSFADPSLVDKLRPRPIAHAFGLPSEMFPSRNPEKDPFSGPLSVPPARDAEYDAYRGLAYLRPDRYARAATIGPVGGPVRALASDRYGHVTAEDDARYVTFSRF